MARTLVCALVGWMAVASAAGGARPAQPDGVALLLSRLEQVVAAGRPEAYEGLLSASAGRELASAFAASVVRPGATRTVIRERDRIALPGTLPGDGFELTVEAFVESDREARLDTWSLEVTRVGGRAQAADAPAASAWVIAGQRILGTLPGIHRLQLDDRQQFSGRQIVIADEDFEITIPQADIFVAEAGGTPTALVVLGRGQMRFAPTQPAERGQVKLFAGDEVADDERGLPLHQDPRRRGPPARQRRARAARRRYPPVPEGERDLPRRIGTVVRPRPGRSEHRGLVAAAHAG